ncbi:alpha/beta-hydrolase [Jaminaea rosea]|uniref:Alpha/beta-hydrolase n=1 Tax=Jaminaea rosea TaxID=1569628 RepID=A0A316V2F8_9BASI|nr:alpha/beta-hydrolase [Jaminaea rosea]PWN30751.1 alpha/beta-hydrolase [Jaminaea rosea]
MSEDTQLQRKAPGRDAAPIKHHPMSLQYIRLRLSAALIRGALGLGMFLAQYILQGVPSDVTVTHTTFPSRDKNRKLRVHIYQPKSLTKSSSPPPIHVNFHGSGFMIPSLGSDRQFCGDLASRLGCVVLDCDYRKAPEWPWPAAVQDAEDAILYALSQSGRWDTRRCTVGGFSAGGNLALCASTLHGKDLCGVLAFYPPTNLSVDRELKAPPPEKHSGAIPLGVAKMFDQSYILSVGVDRTHPLVSPVKADPGSFPPLVWLTCARGDTLYRDGKALIEKLKGTPEGQGPSDLYFHDVSGEGHAFDKAARKGTARDAKREESYKLALEAVQRAWKLGPGGRGADAARL